MSWWTRAGRPHITDFGLARRLDSDATITGSGTILGTPAYMPPEQASGQTSRITAASDVYSLGAILYELLTGQPPFRAGSQLEIVRMVMDAEPPKPRLLNPAVDVRIEAICLRCLAKEPAQRFQSAGELAKDLKRFLEGEPVHSRVRRRPVQYVRIALVAAVCLLAMVLAWVLRKPAKPLPVTHAEIIPAAKPPQSVTEIPPAKPPTNHKKQEARAKVVVAPVTAPAPAPISASLSPEVGSGYNQTFSFHYAASPELDSPAQFEVDFRDDITAGARHCNIRIEPSTGRVQLQFDPLRGPALRVSGNLGTLDRIENSICAVDLSGVALNRRDNAA